MACDQITRARSSPILSDYAQSLIENPTNIRHICIIGEPFNGKTTLANYLISNQQPAITNPNPNPRPVLDHSFHSVLYYNKENSDNPGFLVNLFDTPGDSDFSHDVGSALRLSDGAFLVVDYKAGIREQTEDLLCQTLSEGIKPVIFINKFDQVYSNPQPSTTLVYESLYQTLADANGMVSSYASRQPYTAEISPVKDNVVIGSALHGWSFTLRSFARRYSQKFAVDEDKLLPKLWGDNYFNPQTRKWTKTATPKHTSGDERPPQTLRRAFEVFVLDPIFKIFEATSVQSKAILDNILHRLKLTLPPANEHLKGEALFHLIMRQFLPSLDTLFDTIITHLPSPLTAQPYRIDRIYEGPTTSEPAAGIQSCDPTRRLLLQVAKVMPTSEPNQFYALCRVFSGTLTKGESGYVWPTEDGIQGRQSTPHKTTIPALAIPPGFTFDRCPAGNIIHLIAERDSFPRGATVSNHGSLSIRHFKKIKPSKPSLFRIGIEANVPSDLPRLIENLKYLTSIAPGAQVSISETGEYMIGCPSDSYLRYCLKTLEENDPIPLKTTDIFVTRHESVCSTSIRRILSKTPDKHSRIWATAEPLGEALTVAIEQGKIGPQDDFRNRATFLTDRYGWDPQAGRKIWCFAPDNTGPNALVNMTNNIMFLNEIKDQCVSGFHWATKEGVLCEETMRGVRVNILDVTIGAVIPRMRGRSSHISTMRRVTHGTALTASPVLQEPVLTIEIYSPQEYLGRVTGMVDKKRGKLISVGEDRSGRVIAFRMFAIRAYIPASETIGFTDELRFQTNGQGFHTVIRSHWEAFDESSPLEEGSRSEALVLAIRKRKGLKPTIPPLSDFEDKL